MPMFVMRLSAAECKDKAILCSQQTHKARGYLLASLSKEDPLIDWLVKDEPGLDRLFIGVFLKRFKGAR